MRSSWRSRAISPPTIECYGSRHNPANQRYRWIHDIETRCRHTQRNRHSGRCIETPMGTVPNLRRQMPENGHHVRRADPDRSDRFQTTSSASVAPSMVPCAWTKAATSPPACAARPASMAFTTPCAPARPRTRMPRTSPRPIRQRPEWVASRVRGCLPPHTRPSHPGGRFPLSSRHAFLRA